MDMPIMSSGPHIHSGASDRRIMLDVIIALLPAAVAGVVLFGLPSGSSSPASPPRCSPSFCLTWSAKRSRAWAT